MSACIYDNPLSGKREFWVDCALHTSIEPSLNMEDRRLSVNEEYLLRFGHFKRGKLYGDPVAVGELVEYIEDPGCCCHLHPPCGRCEDSKVCDVCAEVFYDPMHHFDICETCSVTLEILCT